MQASSVFATVLSGGGARGAYQAGVLRAVFEIARDIGNLEMFRRMAGVSAGAINATYIAGELEDLDRGTASLCEMWRTIKAETVFRTDYSSVTRNALKLVRGISLGGLSQNLRPVTVGLLNTTPLRELIAQNVSFSRINQNLNSQRLYGLAISATDYSTSMGVTFVQAQPEIGMWSSANRISQRAELGPDHVMASCSIPVFFPPWNVDGRAFGDGCLRNTAPLSPAVHFGADRLIVVGVRRWKTQPLDASNNLQPSLGRVLSVLINAIFMDAVEVDLERIHIINNAVKQMRAANVQTKFRPIEAFYLNPSQSLSEIAQSHEPDLPKIIRFLLHGLGTTEESSELLSYLLFEPGYCAQLVELGYRDTQSRADALSRFIADV